jgi:hypothetical protein
MISKLVNRRNVISPARILLATAAALLFFNPAVKSALTRHAESTSSGYASGQDLPSVTPLWFQSSEDDPASMENDTPFPDSKVVVNAQWTTPRYYPNPRVQAADIIPVTWASDGYSYVVGDDGSVYQTKATTVMARIVGGPPADNSIPKMDFELLAHDAFPYGCPKSVSADSCYSVGFTNVGGIFYAATYDKGYPVVGDDPPGHTRIDYSVGSISQTSWHHGSVNFPKPVDSGVVSFVEIGRGQPSHDSCAANTLPNGCIYAIVLQGGYQDPKDPNGMDQFNATQVYLARMAVGTPEQQYQEVLDPLRWQWFAGFDSNNRPTWIQASDPQLPQAIRSLSYPRTDRSGCAAGGQAQCLFWDEAAGRAGHVNYPHMAYDAVLDRYLLTFTDWYYRDFEPPSEKGPMVQGGAEGIVLEAPHPWGPWSFVVRSPYLGSGNGYGPSFPVQWEGPLTPNGQDLWMVWAANFSGCGKPMLVPDDRCQGVYGMNLRRMHFTLEGLPGSVRRPWYDQEIGFASPGSATFRGDTVKIVGNGNLAIEPDPFAQFKDNVYHDAFHYVYQRVQGNGSIEAEMHSPTLGVNSTAGPEASAGLMIRESTYVIGQTKNGLEGQRLSSGDTFSEAARYAYIGVRKDGAVFLQYRDEHHVVRSRILPDACLGGCVLRISRQDNRISASFSGADRVFKEIGNCTFSQPLTSSVTMGMVAISDSVSTFPQYVSYGNEFSHFRMFSGSTTAGNQ